MPRPFNRQGGRRDERRPRDPSQLPEVAVVQVTGTDPQGDAIARPVTWEGSGPPPMILMAPEPQGRPALAPGQRVLARLRPIPGNPGRSADASGPGRYEGRSIRRIDDTPGRILGVFRPGGKSAGETGPAGRGPAGRGPAGRGPAGKWLGRQGNGPREDRIIPTDRRAKAEWLVPPGEDGGAEANELVLAEPLPHHRLGLKPARVIERLGSMGDARSISLIAIHTHDIPQTFPDAALAEAALACPAPLGRRTDLRDLKLVTIDGEDARDFDDAVFAEPVASAAPGTGGFRLVVAIADVAHYVGPGSALDHAARTRGNSVYFPDRVVPMLPEALSNDLCSLRPGEDRPCLFAELTIDAGGRKTAHRFGRGLMRSAARLTYEQVQRAHDADGESAGGQDAGGPDADGQAAGGQNAGSQGADAQGAGATSHLPLAPLYAAFRALLAAREARGTLDLDLPERQVKLDEAGHVAAVLPRPRLDSHRLIEEFMVLANVAAAEELEQRRQPTMYRVHAPPTDEKVAALRGFLNGLGINLPPGNQLHPRDLDRVLRRVAGTAEAPLVNEVMLRSQSQAAYSADNIGHFGLALSRYAHFTSPIRRYADLLVHRALISGLGLGDGGLGAGEAARFADIAEHITATERRAQLAEREAIDRYLAAFMMDKVGAHFAARISGVTRFGIFVTILENSASGLLPLSALPDDYWQHDETAQTLTGRHTRQTFRLAQQIEVRLAEASPVTGGLVFQFVPDRAATPDRAPGHVPGEVPLGGRGGRRSRDR
jgi:ribonuclease R